LVSESKPRSRRRTEDLGHEGGGISLFMNPGARGNAVRQNEKGFGRNSSLVLRENLTGF
jgi:hypothetical protein